MSTGRPTTDDEILDAVRRYAAEHGHGPRAKDWTTGPGRPCRGVMSRLGGFRAAAIKAGVPPPPTDGRANRIWSPERIIEVALRWTREKGRPPTCNEWSASPKPGETFYPHRSVVNTYFGSWNAMMAAAGLSPRDQGEHGRKAAARERSRDHSRERANLSPETANGALTGAAREDSEVRSEHVQTTAESGR